MDYYLYRDRSQCGYTCWEYLGSRKAIAQSRARFFARHPYVRDKDDTLLLCAMPDDEPFDITKAEIIETL